MIKRIIFDLDNTLVTWKEEYKKALKRTIEYYKLDIDYITASTQIVEEYEKQYDRYTKENMTEFINKKYNLNLKITFVEKWLHELKSMSEVDNDVIEVLKYLKEKYELVILTNWFKESQISRIKKAKIDSFFDEIYYGDDFIKPNPISFQTAIGNHHKNECIMIGDNYKVDIEGAINFGMKTIMITNKDIEENDKLKVIRNVKELKEIL